MIGAPVKRQDVLSRLETYKNKDNFIKEKMHTKINNINTHILKHIYRILNKH